MIKKIEQIVFIGLVIYTIFYFVESFIIITYPYQISYPEGFILNQSFIISQGLPIYKDISEYPYLVVNYPPIYPFLCAIFVKLFGISFIWGRLITFISSILVGFLIYKFLQRETSKTIAIISALLFISSSYIYKNNPLCRVDMLGLFFSLCGLYLFLKSNNIGLPILFFLFGLYTKPTFISAPLAVAVFLFLNNKKRALSFTALMVFFYLIIFFFLNHLTHGEFYKHNFVYNLNTFIFKQALKHYIWMLQNHAILILFSLLYVFYSSSGKKPPVLVIYFIISSIVALSVGKIGANMNYFFEMIALSCILTGLGLGKLRSEINERAYNYLSLGALSFQLILFAHMPYLTEPTATKLSRRVAEQVSEIVANTDGEIISEDAGLLIKNKKNILFQPFEITQLANQKIWDQTQFINDIKNRRFSLIILFFDVDCWVDEERLTSEMVEAIRAHYSVSRKIGEYYLYQPIHYQ
ncbi:MAG: glycosyltransferase family 39 protein [candidate division WOR-3 bacterium]